MSKDEQRAAAERILTRSPLSEEEVGRLRYLAMEIEDYPAPDPKRLQQLANWMKA